MTAELLREAAALMRERAEAATGMAHRWVALGGSVAVGRVFCGQVMVAKTDETLGGAPFNAEHIASWHPAVALAVADWLDSAASGYVEAEPLIDAALVVARAYLGRAS